MGTKVNAGKAKNSYEHVSSVTSMATFMEYMNEKYGVKTVDFEEMESMEVNDSNWGKYWNNEKRVCVIMPEDLMDRLNDGEKVKLNLGKCTKRTEKLGEYTMYRIAGFKVLASFTLGEC